MSLKWKWIALSVLERRIDDRQEAIEARTFEPYTVQHFAHNFTPFSNYWRYFKLAYHSHFDITLLNSVMPLRVVNGSTRWGPNPKINLKHKNHARKKPKIKLGLKTSAMLPSYFDYIFVHLKQKVRLRPELNPKFLSSLGPNPNPTRKPGPTYNFDASWSSGAGESKKQVLRSKRSLENLPRIEGSLHFAATCSMFFKNILWRLLLHLIFHHTRCITSKRATSVRNPSPRHCSPATQLLSKKWWSGG